MTDDEIRRTIAATALGQTLHESAARACFEAMLAAQEAGATGEAKVAILVAFHREWKVMEATVDELGVGASE